MSSFTLPLVVETLSDGRNWKLLEPFEYHVGSKESEEAVYIPIGFVTDFASTDVLQWVASIMTIILAITAWIIPYWLIVLFLAVILSAIVITPYGRHNKAAVVHDFLYTHHKYSRAMADLIFYEAIKVANGSEWRARMMYAGVRLGGWAVWNKKVNF